MAGEARPAEACPESEEQNDEAPNVGGTFPGVAEGRRWRFGLLRWRSGRHSRNRAQELAPGKGLRQKANGMDLSFLFKRRKETA